MDLQNVWVFAAVGDIDYIDKDLFFKRHNVKVMISFKIKKNFVAEIYGKSSYVNLCSLIWTVRVEDYNTNVK